jgi:ATP-binding protein involved in chromosome partitioning
MFREVDVPVLGIVENMSVYRCPECGHTEHIFGSGGGRRTADELGIPLLGEVPIDPRVAASGDSGTPAVLAHPDSPVAEAFRKIADAVAERLGVDTVARSASE